MILYLSLSYVELGEILCISGIAGETLFSLKGSEEEILRGLRDIWIHNPITILITDTHISMLQLYVRQRERNIQAIPMIPYPGQAKYVRYMYGDHENGNGENPLIWERVEDSFHMKPNCNYMALDAYIRLDPTIISLINLCAIPACDNPILIGIWARQAPHFSNVLPLWTYRGPLFHDVIDRSGCLLLPEIRFNVYTFSLILGGMSKVDGVSGNVNHSIRESLITEMVPENMDRVQSECDLRPAIIKRVHEFLMNHQADERGIVSMDTVWDYPSGHMMHHVSSLLAPYREVIEGRIREQPDVGKIMILHTLSGRGKMAMGIASMGKVYALQDRSTERNRALYTRYYLLVRTIKNLRNLGTILRWEIDVEQMFIMCQKFGKYPSVGNYMDILFHEYLIDNITYDSYFITASSNNIVFL